MINVTVLTPNLTAYEQYVEKYHVTEICRGGKSFQKWILQKNKETLEIRFEKYHLL